MKLLLFYYKNKKKIEKNVGELKSQKVRVFPLHPTPGPHSPNPLHSPERGIPHEVVPVSLLFVHPPLLSRIF